MPAPEGEAAGLPAAQLPEQDDPHCPRDALNTWARLIRKIFEADPLLCPCGGRMRIVSFMTEPGVIDRIVRHLRSARF
jgi:hypothetical protein